jgi:hypothetical protein
MRTGIKDWLVIDIESGWVHVVPEDDDIEHRPEDCWCHPQEDHGHMLVHNALDRRDEYLKSIH